MMLPLLSAPRASLWMQRFVLVALALAVYASAWADDAPSPVVIDLAAPLVSPAPILADRLPESASVSQVTAVRIFEELLVPVGGQPTADETLHLVRAIHRYVVMGDKDDVGPFLAFLELHPSSAWSPSLRLNLGLLYRRGGFFSRAFEQWRLAWTQGKAASDLASQTVANRAVAELMSIHAWVGRVTELRAMLSEVSGRDFTGVASEKVNAARLGLKSMENDTGTSFKCGPYSVGHLKRMAEHRPDMPSDIVDIVSTPRGTSLAFVHDLATKQGMDYVMVRKQPGVPIPVPSVVHWKVDHYSAITAVHNDSYDIYDGTMDEFYGKRMSVGRAAIEEEASGYYLAPASYAGLPGYVPVSPEESVNVWGRGNPGPPNDPKACTDCDKSSGGDGTKGCKGMMRYSFKSMMVGLSIRDIPLWYEPTRGPSVAFYLSYNEKDGSQPSTFFSSNVGPKWTHGWGGWAQLVSGKDGEAHVVRCYQPGGGAFDYPFAAGSATAYDYFSGSTLEYLGSDRGYVQHFGDGSSMTYSWRDGSVMTSPVYYLTAQTDQYGYALRFEYESFSTGSRLVACVDALGQRTTVQYGSAAFPLQITGVADPFGRSVSIIYTPGGLLKSVTDMGGITSSVAYELGNDYVRALTTPYGTTRFSRFSMASNHFGIDAIDPQGDVERMEFWGQVVIGEDPSQVVKDTFLTQMSDEVPAYIPGYQSWTLGFGMYRNSFYWDKKAMKTGGGLYANAVNYHWLHAANSVGGGSGATGRLLESEKHPGSSREWYLYPGSSSASEDLITSGRPVVIARKIDDGSTQARRFSYNGQGNVTSSTDPRGRETHYTYDGSGYNVTTVSQKRGDNIPDALLAQYAYDANGHVLAMTDASGRRTSMTYNNDGQLESITYPSRSGAPDYSVIYDYASATGRLTAVRDPAGVLAQYTYDAIGRVESVTDRSGYVVRYQYDNLDRVTKITHPDGTIERVEWERLDPVRMWDRENRCSQRIYNALQQVVTTIDAEGRVNTMEWCRCGALGSLTDSLNRRTVWNYDLAGRLTDKTYPDQTVESYQYEPLSGRLKSVMYPDGHVKTLSYNIDDTLLSLAYTGGAVRATAGVYFSYDSIFSRLASMSDGIGTTNYSYNPILTTEDVLHLPVTGAGQLASISGPLPSSMVEFAYDEWSRLVGRTVDGASESTMFDSLARVSHQSNALGVFDYGYVGDTGRLAQVVGPVVSTAYDYLPVGQDLRLAGITHRLAGNALVSSHAYGYSPTGRIGSWAQSFGDQPAVGWIYGYDRTDQLTAADKRLGGLAGSLISRTGYDYDAAGNRVGLSAMTGTQTAVGGGVFNANNQLMSLAAGGRTRIAGHTDKPAIVTVNGQKATLDGADNSFSAEVDTVLGSNQFMIQAADANGNKTSTRYQLDTANPANAKSFAYDKLGNCLDDGVNRYTWDAESRLVQIDSKAGGKQTVMAYDGLGRRVRITDRINGVVTRDVSYLWVGSSIVEERTGDGSTILKRYFGQGCQIGSNKFYYTRDHLGSIRELIDQSGAVRARYDYDAYGVRTKTGGDMDADFGYTGHYQHAPSGLTLTWFRAYDPTIGRWLSRDPAGEKGGMNLYGYVKNCPIMRVDIFGLMDWTFGFYNPSDSPGVTDFPGRLYLSQPSDFSKAAGRENSCSVPASDLGDVYDFMKNWLKNHPGDRITGISFYGHGAPGMQWLGDNWLDASDSRWSKIGGLMPKFDFGGAFKIPASSIAFKGCRVGAGDEGLKYLQDISKKAKDIMVTGSTGLYYYKSTFNSLWTMGPTVTFVNGR